MRERLIDECDGLPPQYWLLTEDWRPVAVPREALAFHLSKHPGLEWRTVARTTLSDGRVLSTVFYYFPMVSEDGYGWCNFCSAIVGGGDDIARYATVEEARAGHEDLVRRLEEGRELRLFMA